jgi:hypothetical protein
VDVQEVLEHEHKVALPTTMARSQLPAKFQGTIVKTDGYLPAYLEMRTVILGTVAIADLTPDTLKMLLDDPNIKHITLAESNHRRR